VIKVVRENKVVDGIGAMMLRKFEAMTYAEMNNAIFIDRPLINFMIHPSDKIYKQSEKINFLNKFSNLYKIQDKWAGYQNLKEFEIEDIFDTSGVLVQISPFAHIQYCINKFINIDYKETNNIVFHIRRGNVVQDNWRWIDEYEYINIIKNYIDILASKFRIHDPNIIILTDSVKNKNSYKPLGVRGGREWWKWSQEWLVEDENGNFPLTSIDFDLIKRELPDVNIISDMDTFDSLMLMVNAKVLFQSRSAFSKLAGLLSKNIVIQRKDTSEDLDRSFTWDGQGIYF
jgi:hypothetical protein